MYYKQKYNLACLPLENQIPHDSMRYDAFLYGFSKILVFHSHKERDLYKQAPF